MEETLSFLQQLFSDQGFFPSILPQYEHRIGQQEMALRIWEAFEKEKVALIEAGTGIGKSLAYLAAAFLWSYQTGEKVLISTYTIALQEQLLEKDIPLLLKALNIDLHIVLAKGMNNYVCLRKLDEISKNQGFFDSSVDQLVSWTAKTTDGTHSAIPFSVSKEFWRKVSAESESCSYVKCPHYKQCFFFNARTKAQDADILIVNHHLLMAHILAKEEQKILPSFSRIVIDEAHHLEQVARNSLTKVLARVELFRILARVHSDAHPEVSRFFFLRDQLKAKGYTALSEKLNKDLPEERRKLQSSINQAFDFLEEAFFSQNQEYKWRLTPTVFQTSFWQKTLIPSFEKLREELACYSASLWTIEKEIPDECKSQLENALVDISAVREKIKQLIELIDHFFDEEHSNVRWAEKTPEGMALCLTTLDVAPFMKENLFEKTKSSLLCSATLAIGGDFQHTKTRLGLDQEAIEEIYSSPFDFRERTRLLGISDLPPPNDPSFIEHAVEIIRRAVQITNGGAFVLFTSYDMLTKCAEKFDDPNLLKQKDQSRQILLEEFKRGKDRILFGTDSFWEGVDVAGDALRLVIIVKLPFPVPSDPLIQARAELLKKQGRDSFHEDSLPHAVMKFKQGFGRLMRKKEDRGCVLCLDNRLFNRSYGKTFLKSLPECLTSFQSREEIYQEMKQFYRA